MKAGITKLAALSFANAKIRLTLIGKFCCLLSFFSCWKSRGARGERVAGKMGRRSEQGEAYRRGCERGRKRESEPTAHW